MINAAKVLAMSGLDIILDKSLIEKAWVEFEEKKGRNYIYAPLIGDRSPALDYRN